LRRTIPHTSGPGRWALQIEAPRVERAERDATAEMDEVRVVSDPDAREFPASRAGRVRVVRQGVAAKIDPQLARRSDGRTLLFVGRLDVRHNIAAAVRLCQNLLPRVRRHFPEARVLLVGASPGRQVRALGRLPGVSVPGPVPDLQEVYAGAAALVAPLTFCTGIQNKLIEAAAAGLPVITTPEPAEALGETLARELWAAAGDEELANAILGVLSDPRAAESRAARARAAVRETFKWSNLLEALEHPLGAPA
jgi:glycosyltransferase involved in cell wall biosynthesis